MILPFFPDHTRPDFNLDAPCPVYGWPNMIIHAFGNDITYPVHDCTLSIKCAFGGSELYETDGTGYRVDDSSFLILNRGHRYASRIPAGPDVEAFCVFFRPGFFEEVAAGALTASELLLDDPTSGEHGQIELVERLYPHDRQLSPRLLAVRERLLSGTATEGWLEERFHALAESLLGLHRDVLEEIARLPGVRYATKVEIYHRLTRAREYIEGNLGASLKLPEIAAAACLSTHHFLRLFKQLHGVTPHQYVVRRRLERAQHLLATSSLTVSEICNGIGMESLGSFSWLFRQRFGCSPDAYRRALTGRPPRGST